MPSGTIRTVSIIGAGNVAVRLGIAMKQKGIIIKEVCNRTAPTGRALARKLGAAYISDPGRMDPRADLFIISVSDKAVARVAGKLRTKNLVVHTSGPVDMRLLRKASDRTGVLYPLQTFRKGRRLPLNRIPFCIEAAGKKDEALLEGLGRMLSPHVVMLDSRRRRILHLAAVFSANFTNYLYSAAEALLEEHAIPFGLLEPIIIQTAGNAKHGNLFSLQTGPAVREDREIMDLHRELLRGHKEYLRIYDIISTSIIKQKKSHGKL